MGVKSKAILTMLAVVLGLSLGIKHINTQYKLAVLKQQHQKQLLKTQRRHAVVMYLLRYQHSESTQCN
ncbi:hypothetical protein [Pseudoalteromonas nigrifaciens]|uniref:hypothetical protein n=1 Tax=Pseudoalteromonas nigrifaciens TaxID=28109 RepID=UPI003F9C4BD6